MNDRLSDSPRLLVFNQMCGRLAWETAEDLANRFGPVALLTGQADTLARGSTDLISVFPATPHLKGGNLVRLWSWFRYALRAFCWNFRWSRKTPSLYFSNPPIGPWVGYMHRLLRGQRYAVIVYDIWPDYIVRLGKLKERGLVARCWRAFNRRCYERADVVLTLGDYMSKNLAGQFDPAQTPAGSIATVYPWADTESLRPLAKAENPFAREHGQVDKLTVMYSGNMGIGHELGSMLEAAETLQSVDRLRFMFIGNGPRAESVREFIASHQLQNAVYLSWQPEDQIRYSLSTADVALVSLEDSVAGLAVPSKAFSFLAVGAPLLVVCSPDCELAQIVRQYDCGWIVAPGDARELTELVRRIAVGEVDLLKYKRQARLAAEQIGSRRNSQLISAALAPMVARAWQ